MANYLVHNWEAAYNSTLLLFEKIKKSNFTPDIIVGVARGGWIPARLLSDFFSIKNTANIKVEAYQLIGQKKVKAKLTQDISINIQNKNILIVDDIADSGSSLKVILDSLKSKNVKQIKTATLFYKTSSLVKPDYYCHITDSWVVFPWEYFETMTELKQNLEIQGISSEEIKSKLKDIGIPPLEIEFFMEQ